ncbi:putative nucleic acid binding protein 22 [Elsinoe australis]|uniref:Putative nucleic acid binding protein 22 n=1 Tax=Elsinoe australis TaxID=40998 RepID=A0A4U7AYI8_9PEZI|nr:putative nucleic acid binding protein 22 [Elsinoe australis]
MSWDTPTPAGDWGAEPTDSGFNSGHENNGSGGEDGFQIDKDHVSKHQGGCFNCGQEGHNKADCPEPPKNGGECYNCGEMGHNKADCPNPRVERAFTGTCNECGEEGHRASQCPQRPPPTCRVCRQEGHLAAQCENPVAIYETNIPLLPPDEAWSLLTAADNSKESISFRFALNCYTRAMPDLTFVDMERELRAAGFYFHLVAKEQPIADTKTICNLQGKRDCTYVVSFQAGYKPTRPKFASGWPTSAEDNMTRLADAGYVMDRGIPKCGNCDELGHITKSCPNERVEREKMEIKCFNCSEVGHYLRDCPNPRQDKNACRNCKQPGHKAADCTEPRSAEGVECRNCGETGHFGKDCPSRQPMTCRNCNAEGHKAAECTEERKMTCRKCNEDGHMARDCPSAPPLTCFNCYQEGHRSSDCPNERIMKCRNCEQIGHAARECPEPRNPATMQCRNCDAMGHMSKDCPEPRDYSRVQCRNCNEYGHTRVRCQNPPAEDISAGMAATSLGGGDASGGADDWMNNPAGGSGGGNNWETPATSAPIVEEGGWGSAAGTGASANW